MIVALVARCQKLSQNVIRIMIMVKMILEGGGDHEDDEDEAQCTKATLGAMHCRSTFGK